ncbi:MAG: hypothetical protein LBQ88_09800 [Treponema sp.]|nr:hypothetical protein [Treponema sp.]
MGVQLQEAQIPEIWETEEEKNLSIGQLKYACLQYGKLNFQGHEYLNKSTGKSIRVSQDGLMEWWRKSRRREHIISVRSLDFFLENGIFKGESPDYQRRKKIESASCFESECKVNGKLFKVILTTRKPVYDIDKFRYYGLKDIEIAPK